MEVGAVPPLSLTKGPIRCPIPEQLIQRDTKIFLVKLLTIVRAASVPASLHKVVSWPDTPSSSMGRFIGFRQRRIWAHPLVFCV